MKELDIDSWKRKSHFQFFNQMDIPHFNITADVDITYFYSYIKKNDLSFFKTLLYFVTKTANEIEEFRLRIRNDRVIEHEVIHPSFTVMSNKDVFSFCDAYYVNSYDKFIENVDKAIEAVEENPVVADEEFRDETVYITSIPWVSFKSVSHPINVESNDSVPRLAWGKFYEQNDELKLPFSVQVHHALMDGQHVGLYYKELQENLNNPEKVI